MVADELGLVAADVVEGGGVLGQRLALKPPLELLSGRRDIAELLHSARPYLSLRRKPVRR